MPKTNRRMLWWAVAASVMTLVTAAMPLGFVVFTFFPGDVFPVPIPFVEIQSVFAMVGLWQAILLLAATIALWPVCVLLCSRALAVLGSLLGGFLVLWGVMLVLLAFTPSRPDAWWGGPPMLMTGLLGAAVSIRRSRDIRRSKRAATPDTESPPRPRRRRWLCTVVGLSIVLLVVGTPLVLWAILCSREQAASGQGAVVPLTTTQSKGESNKLIRAAVAEGRIAFRLTTPEELLPLLAPPVRKSVRRDGMENLTLHAAGVDASFRRMREQDAPFTLRALRVDGQAINIGAHRQVALRTCEDLRAADRFWGLCNMSLARLDLREQEKALRGLSFDSRTVWPSADRLPPGFDPPRILEEAKNPGLGVRALHSQGIDARGVHIAIFDQALLRSHREYAHRLANYEDLQLGFVPPQMHGASVASIAVGKTCGVAPGARLTFIVAAIAMDNRPYCYAMERIMDMNRHAKPADRIRVVSISNGGFPIMPHFRRWQETLAKAERSGILVVTCDPTMRFALGGLARIPGQDPDDPRSYRLDRCGWKNDALLVPTSRTVASHEGPDLYTYWAEGGLSWTVPYLAGLAAMGYQVNPDLQPQQAVDLLLQTATATDIGPVVNPRGFIDAVRRINVPNTDPGGNR